MPPQIPTLETRRLWLRPIELADAAQAQVLFPRWEIVQYMNAIVPWPYPPDGALTFYRDVAIPAMECGDAWHWSVREGMRVIATEERDFVSGRHRAEVWELTREEWRARRR